VVTTEGYGCTLAPVVTFTGTGLSPTTSTVDLVVENIGAASVCDATICKANEYVKSGVCTACAGVSSKILSPDSAGDDASAGDTVCDASSCAANEYVSSNVCTACPAGTTRAAGDNLNAGDTVCAKTLCALNEYVSSNMCVKCGVVAVNSDGKRTTVLTKTTNTAGDDASGADTLCDAKLCAVNQYVKSNVCTACPTGSTNDANDDATGADTSCDTTAARTVPGAAPGAPGAPGGPGGPAAESGSRPNKSIVTSLVICAFVALATVL